MSDNQLGNELAGKVAIVTGAGRNIGRAIALQLAQAGASVVVNARSNKVEADSVVREIKAAGGNALAVLGDVGDPKAVAALADATLKKFGPFTIALRTSSGSACGKAIATRIAPVSSRFPFIRHLP